MKLIQLLVIFLLISFILFIIFQVEDMEGFNIKNIEGMTNDIDPELPACSSNRESSSSTPSCGSSSEDLFLDSFHNENDNYILKTQVVAPVCPKDPYESAMADWKKEHDAIHKKEKEASDAAEKERQRKKDEDDAKNKENALRDASYNSLLPLTQPQPPSNPSNLLNTPSNDLTASSKDQVQPNFFNSNTMLNNNTQVSTPEKKEEPQPAKAEDKKSTPEDVSKCPPCPACERCPEPTVDCKKVINYKSKSYPVPVIADFSEFSRF
jgi:hypothetical protein